MTSFHFHADLQDPAKLLAAVAEASGERDVRMLKGWKGADPDTGEPIGPQDFGAVNIEWYRRKGRFSLDVKVFGREFAARETSARFSRAVARALGRPVLFGDCSAFGFSYFMAAPDGSIWAVLLVIGDDDDVMDVDTYDHKVPAQCFPRLTYTPIDPLPERALGDPDSWTHGDTNCDTPIPGKLCRVFAGPCPRYRCS